MFLHCDVCYLNICFIFKIIKNWTKYHSISILNFLILFLKLEFCLLWILDFRMFYFNQKVSSNRLILWSICKPIFKSTKSPLEKHLHTKRLKVQTWIKKVKELKKRFLNNFFKEFRRFFVTPGFKSKKT